MFKLNFDPSLSTAKINLRDHVYLVGSCFSDEVGSRLSTHKFNTLQNPFGTIYNPISIFKTLAGNLDPLNSVESHGVFYHWDCHGKISALSLDDLTQTVRSATETSSHFLDNSTHLVITLGSAYVYEHTETGRVVANCHKVVGSKFSKRLLTKEEIVQAFTVIYQNLNPNLNIIFTVSPVRHIRDGLVENNLSKAILLQAVHEIVAEHKNIEYFPAYEIMNDELRDYRFYAEDMAHPSHQAVEYIWQKFSSVYFDKDTKQFMKEWIKIMQALRHKPFQSKSKQHREFLRHTLSQLNAFKGKIDVSEELLSIQNQLQ